AGKPALTLIPVALCGTTRQPNSAPAAPAAPFAPTLYSAMTAPALVPVSKRRSVKRTAIVPEFCGVTLNHTVLKSFDFVQECTGSLSASVAPLVCPTKTAGDLALGDAGARSSLPHQRQHADW